MSQPEPRYRPGSRKGVGGRRRLSEEGLTQRVRISLRPEDLERLDRLAEEHGSRSATVRAALEALEREDDTD